jgi:hypothetical protein
LFNQRIDLSRVQQERMMTQCLPWKEFLCEVAQSNSTWGNARKVKFPDDSDGKEYPQLIRRAEAQEMKEKFGHALNR